MKMPRLIVFASGTKEGGGSGFEELVLATKAGILLAEISAVISNYENGGVRARAKKLNIPFIYFSPPWTKERYQEITKGLVFDFIALSGWMKLVLGLDPRITFNIHPGPLPDFGGPGMYGHHVHEAVLKAFLAGKIAYSAVSMHFITDEYDRGPVFFHLPVRLVYGDTADDIAKRVNKQEHLWQSRITNLVVWKEIFWDGKDPRSLRVPEDYQFLP